MSRITGTTNNKRLNKAIVDKIESVLENTESIRDLDIQIHGAYDEIPTIRYNIEEIVRWDSESEGKNE